MRGAFQMYWPVVLICDTILVVYIHRAILRAKRASDFKFRFRITDLWALALALSPTLFLYGQLNNDSAHSQELAKLILALIIPHQLGGIFLMRLLLRSDEAANVTGSAWRSFIDVLGGALMGLLLPLFSIAAAGGFFLILLLFFGTLPFSLLLIPVLFIYYGKRRKAREKTASENPSPTSELPP